jgi:hypothetical protein
MIRLRLQDWRVQRSTAGLVQVSAAGAPDLVAPGRQRWSQRQTLVLAGITWLLAVSLVLSPSWYRAFACLVVILVYLSRSRFWSRMVRFLVLAVIPYFSVWAGFVTLRGYGNESPLAPTTRLYARRLECWLFGGEMPSSILQRHFFDPNHLRPYDYLLSTVYWSFFLVPSIVVFCLAWTDRSRFRRALSALLITLAIGVPCFALIPTDPPWMNPAIGDPNPRRVERINYYVSRSLGNDSSTADRTFRSETNPSAAMPSIHFAVTCLMLFAVWQTRRRWGALMVLEVLLMGLALVYLGEHLVIDEIAGLLLAVVAWRCSPGVVTLVASRIEPPLTAAVGRRVNSSLELTR